MPIYEYESADQGEACEKCRVRFEWLQGISEPPLQRCPSCGKPVRKLISWCRAAVVETPAEYSRVTTQISDYEREGMWSHAAELGDTHSEKTGDTSMKMRAIDNYAKAGYDSTTLEKHAKAPVTGGDSE